MYNRSTPTFLESYGFLFLFVFVLLGMQESILFVLSPPGKYNWNFLICS